MKLVDNIKAFIDKLPHVRNVVNENKSIHKSLFVPIGHFYSPIVNVEDVETRENEIWKNAATDKVAGIDLNVEMQLHLLKQSSDIYFEIPFGTNKSPAHRYYFKNDFYAYTDGIILYSFLRIFNPKKVIEVGSGFSSAVLLDTNELFLNKELELTFIEPYPDRLKSLISSSDESTVTILESPIQLVDLKIFESLEKNDILFIDSTHVVKTDSDLVFIFFEILPKLQKGVIIHFHDIFYPFEYPKTWIMEGRSWNECYFLRTFLMYNKDFEILFFADFIHRFHKDAFQGMPLAYENTGGNFWLRKI